MAFCLKIIVKLFEIEHVIFSKSRKYVHVYMSVCIYGENDKEKLLSAWYRSVCIAFWWWNMNIIEMKM